MIDRYSLFVCYISIIPIDSGYSPLLITQYLLLNYDRYLHAEAAEPNNEPHTQPQHQARADGATILVAPWLQIPSMREGTAGATRHSDAQAQGGNIRQWVLLARP